MSPETQSERQDPAARDAMSNGKPALVLLNGCMITAENLALMFKALTGRDREVRPEWLTN